MFFTYGNDYSNGSGPESHGSACWPSNRIRDYLYFRILPSPTYWTCQDGALKHSLLSAYQKLKTTANTGGREQYVSEKKEKK